MNAANYIFIFVPLTLICGCQSSAINVEDILLHPPAGIEVPIDAKVVVDASDPDQHTEHLLKNAGYSSTTEYTNTMASMALEAFGRGFSEVELEGDGRYHLIVKTQSGVKENLWYWGGGGQSVQVYCRVETYQGDLVGEYSTSASGNAEYHPLIVSIENAYKKAFIRILTKLLYDKDFVALYKHGYFDAPL